MYYEVAEQKVDVTPTKPQGLLHSAKCRMMLERWDFPVVHRVVSLQMCGGGGRHGGGQLGPDEVLGCRPWDRPWDSAVQ